MPKNKQTTKKSRARSVHFTLDKLVVFCYVRKGGHARHTALRARCGHALSLTAIVAKRDFLRNATLAHSLWQFAKKSRCCAMSRPATPALSAGLGSVVPRIKFVYHRRPHRCSSVSFCKGRASHAPQSCALHLSPMASRVKCTLRALDPMRDSVHFGN